MAAAPLVGSTASRPRLETVWVGPTARDRSDAQVREEGGANEPRERVVVQPARGAPLTETGTETGPESASVGSSSASSHSRRASWRGPIVPTPHVVSSASDS